MAAVKEETKTGGSNIGPRIASLIGRKLHLQENHPIEIMKREIVAILGGFACIDDLDPFVTTEQNFDSLRMPKDHSSRKRSDSFFSADGKVLRTHTSAHQVDLLRLGHRRFVVVGVYRRDQIDRTHYPVFHQMEGLCILETAELEEAKLTPPIIVIPKETKDHEEEKKEDLIPMPLAAICLLTKLTSLLTHMFPNCRMRIREHHFYFTDPSYEIDIQDKTANPDAEKEWLEVLGCGVVHLDIMSSGLMGNPDKRVAWAFGIGLERLVMLRCSIPDIRMLWCTSRKFLDQYSDGKLNKFVPFTEVNRRTCDISFWLPVLPFVFEENDLSDLIRELTNDCEEVTMLSEFKHPTDPTKIARGLSAHSFNQFGYSQSCCFSRTSGGIRISIASHDSV